MRLFTHIVLYKRRPLAGTVLLAGLLGCAGDATAPRTGGLDLARGYWGLTVNHQALLMATVAPYDTTRLVATPRNGFGAPLSGPVLDSVETTFALRNPTDTNVVVTSTGVVRARHPDVTAVVVKVTAQGITHADTIPLVVTAAVPSSLPTHLTLQIAPDARLSLDNSRGRRLVANLLDADGAPVGGAPVRFASSDTMVAVIAQGAATVGVPAYASKTGRVMLYAATTAYGRVLVDSAPLDVIPPLQMRVTVRFRTPHGSREPIGYFAQPADTVSAGAVVVWYNPPGTDGVSRPIDVTFDDPSAAQPSSSELAPFCWWAEDHGDIAPFAQIQSDDFWTMICSPTRERTFPRPGTYTYHSQRYGTGGTIVVMP